MAGRQFTGHSDTSGIGNLILQNPGCVLYSRPCGAQGRFSTARTIIPTTTSLAGRADTPADRSQTLLFTARAFSRAVFISEEAIYVQDSHLR